MRKIAFMISELALADPVPLTLANFTTKSFTRLASAIRLGMHEPPHRSRAECRMVDFCMSQAAVGQRSAHSPQCTQTSSSLTMTRAVCGSAAETYSACDRIGGRRRQAGAQFGLRAVLRDGEAIDRTDVDAGIALDAQLRGEHRLHVAIQAALHFERRLFGGKSEFHFDVDLLEALDQSDVRHEAPLDAVVLVLVRPFVHAHLAAGQASRRAACAPRPARRGRTCGSKWRPDGRARPTR